MKIIKFKNKDIVNFIKSSRVHLKNMDSLMLLPQSVQRGEMIAKEMNQYNLALDMFMYFACNIPLDKLDSVLNKSFTTINNTNKP